MSLEGEVGARPQMAVEEAPMGPEARALVVYMCALCAALVEARESIVDCTSSSSWYISALEACNHRRASANTLGG